jgi:hypothetical protein
MPMIGYLSYTSAEYEAAALLPAFRQGLREIGYVEGQSVVSGGVDSMTLAHPNHSFRNAAATGSEGNRLGRALPGYKQSNT